MGDAGLGRRFLVEKVNHREWKFEDESRPVYARSICSVQYIKDGDPRRWLTLVDLSDIIYSPVVYLTDFDPFDMLVSGDVADPRWAGTRIGSFEGINCGEYENIFIDFNEYPDNPAVPLIRLLILGVFEYENREKLILSAEGKYLDEIDVWESVMEDAFWARVQGQRYYSEADDIFYNSLEDYRDSLYGCEDDDEAYKHYINSFSEAKSKNTDAPG